MLSLNELGLDPDEIAWIRLVAKTMNAEWVKIMGCYVCKSTGKQKDKEGNTVICPMCKGTGEAIKPAVE